MVAEVTTATASHAEATVLLAVTTASLAAAVPVRRTEITALLAVVAEGAARTAAVVRMAVAAATPAVAATAAIARNSSWEGGASSPAVPRA